MPVWTAEAERQHGALQVASATGSTIDEVWARLRHAVAGLSRADR